MRLARYERAGEARLAMVAGEDILDILDALDDLSDAPANGTRDYGFPVGREGGHPTGIHDNWAVSIDSLELND